MRTRSLSVLFACGAALCAPRIAAAQDMPKPGVELRADALLGSVDAYQAGAGFIVPMGYYVRLTTIGAYGAERSNGAWLRSGRAEVLMRFLLDPFRESPWGLSAGGGVSARYTEGGRWRPYLTGVLDLESRGAKGGWIPALQVGLGGGARIGVVLRQGSSRFR